MRALCLILALCHFIGGGLSLLAFPGAEGFGSDAEGGRKGELYTVTSLEESGEGTLSDAVSKPNRIVVFAVGGVIKIKERIEVQKGVTILGQTAPGPGISTYGNGWSFSNADGAVVRYLRIRMGKIAEDKKDAITIAEGHNMIFDHVSVSWGRDETFSISGEEAGNITIQDSIISQGLEDHSAGGLIQTDGGVSLFRNLYIDNKTRNPKVKGRNDFTNNVVYNWGSGGGYIAGGSSGKSYVNIVGNYFISGPETSVTASTRGNNDFSGFVQDNFYDSDKDGKLSGKELGASSENYGDMAIAKQRYEYPAPGRILSAPDALEYVLANAGASKARDAVDSRLVAEVKSFGEQGELIEDESSAPMAYTGRIAKVNREIPVSTEDAMKVDAKSGYTNIEAWANSLLASDVGP